MPYHYFTLEQRANLESLIRAQMSEQPGLAGTLERLRTSDYGICVRCGAEIPYVRLMQSPAIQYCRSCAVTS